MLFACSENLNVVTVIVDNQSNNEVKEVSILFDNAIIARKEFKFNSEVELEFSIKNEGSYTLHVLDVNNNVLTKQGSYLTKGFDVVDKFVLKKDGSIEYKHEN